MQQQEEILGKVFDELGFDFASDVPNAPDKALANPKAQAEEVCFQPCLAVNDACDWRQTRALRCPVSMDVDIITAGGGMFCQGKAPELPVAIGGDVDDLEARLNNLKK